eukprot:569915-Heterocapsa_arctica.AAC.1
MMHRCTNASGQEITSGAVHNRLNTSNPTAHASCNAAMHVCMNKEGPPTTPILPGESLQGVLCTESPRFDHDPPHGRGGSIQTMLRLPGQSN